MTWQMMIAVSALFILARGVDAATLHVSKSGDGSDGLSWETAYTAIGDALAVSASEDEVWVASGTYYESIQMVTGVALYGGFLGNEDDSQFQFRDWEVNSTVIDGSGLHSSVVLIEDFCNINGFTIMNGDTISQGGGIRGGRNQGGRLIVPPKENVVIQDNHIEKNRAGGGGGIAYCNGVIKGNRILNNRGYRYLGGGGLLGCTGYIARNYIANNVAESFEGSDFGGGLASCGGVIENNLVIGNFALGSGGGLADCLGTIRNNTIYGNNAVGFSWFFDINNGGGGGLFECGGQIFNNIMRSNTAPNGPQLFFSHSDYSCIEDGENEGFGVGNIDDDPLFVDPENGDFRLQNGSPCIDSGTITETLTDLDGNVRPVDIPNVGIDGPGAFDMGAYEYQFPQTDLNRNGYTDPMDLFIFGNDWMKVSGASRR